MKFFVSLGASMILENVLDRLKVDGTISRGEFFSSYRRGCTNDHHSCDRIIILPGDVHISVSLNPSFATGFRFDFKVRHIQLTSVSPAMDR